MKPSLLGVFCSAALLLAAGSGYVQAAEAEGHVLAKKSPPVVTGSKLTTETATLLKDGKYVFTAEEDEKIEGKGTFKSDEVVVIDCLSPTRFRRLQTKLEESTHMEILGETVDEPGEADPLTGVPVILEEQKDGSYTATLEKGEATEEQKKALKDIAEEASTNDDLIMYGDQPRKPGEKWDVDVTKLSGFADGENLRGTMAIEFAEVKELGGVRCAVLKCSFDLSGTLNDEDMGECKMTLKGEALVHRALADFVDLESKTEGRMTLAGKADDMPLEMAGPLLVTIRSTFTKPER